jgi:ankyrin repeat protein
MNQEERTESYPLISVVGIPDTFQCYDSLHLMLEKITDSNLEEIFLFIGGHEPFIISQMVQIIISFHSFRPFLHKPIVTLLSLVTLSSPLPLNASHLIQTHPFLAFHLSNSGLFSHSDLSFFSPAFSFLNSLEDLENWQIPKCFADRWAAGGVQLNEIQEFGYEKDSVGFFLKFDDFARLQVQSTDGDFRFDGEICISPYDIRFDEENMEQSLLSVSAFYGAVVCFKFIYMNGTAISPSVCESSVKGGIDEIILICEREHGDFSKCLPIAVRYHRNNVADWLLMNFKVPMFSFFDCIQSTNFPCIFFLLSHNGDINKGNDSGETAFQISSEAGFVEVCKLLIVHGADIHKGNNDEFSPLHSSSQEGHVRVCELLIELEADINKEDIDKNTPLFVSSRRGHIEVCNLLVKKGADIHKVDTDGKTPLFISSQNGHVKIFKLLIEHGADINKGDNNGLTPLHVSSQNGHVEICKLLIELGADVNKCNDNGLGPLHASSKQGHLEICKLLIEHGADINKEDKAKNTPLFISLLYGHNEICKLLLKHGALNRHQQ